LLGQILGTAKALTMSDGAALFLVEADAGHQELVLFRADFDSLAQTEITRTRLPIDDTSIAGHAARTHQPTVVRDAYELPPNATYVLDRSFDEQYHYRRRSMLFVPMVDQLDHLVGLLILVNRKSHPRVRLTSLESVDRYVRPYSRDDVEVARSLGGQAAVAIENAQLYARIERTVESIVETAVTAIDERDPATAGHSLRVAALSTSIAIAISETSDGAYRDVQFSPRQLRELRFAALLHDVGKLVVPEWVLLKAKKLPPVLWERVAARFDLIRRTLELQRCSDSSDHLSAELEELERMRSAVARANEPSILDTDVNGAVAEIAARHFCGPDGAELPYLTSEELHFLELRRGTLDDEERALVENHAEASFRLLRSVLWTDDLQNVATYAYGHHEKLDGSGYPRHLHAEEIPLQSRIICLCDMFDALTQADRPYKSAMSSEAAFGVLRQEAEAGRIDRELLRIAEKVIAATPEMS